MANVTPERDLEFGFEYTTIDGRRRRVTILSETGGDAWRIVHEYRDGEWREVGREPISSLRLQLSSFDPTDARTDPQETRDTPTDGNPDEICSPAREAEPAHGDRDA
ncbi:hypothetical protein A6E15_18270 [Natrinema saccharevitans]|uniref:Uncharacterized protein n=1 Tax=Natrinema saccharevitans TaxID=301967 RepID=A0A1S8AS40_9EURY|nr:hypothetical protein [Natrinema saccharevitans]OLZ39334.1 hypothetical protein A6E15_18270 [Natrinema saccharevitans]